jgi:hypothetical protein
VTIRPLINWFDVTMPKRKQENKEEDEGGSETETVAGLFFLIGNYPLKFVQ